MSPILKLAMRLDHTQLEKVKGYYMKEFLDCGHWLCIDHGRHEVADSVLAWLTHRSP